MKQSEIFKNYHEMLDEESDRGSVILAASMLDEILRQFLIAFFIKVEGPEFKS